MAAAQIAAHVARANRPGREAVACSMRALSSILSGPETAAGQGWLYKGSCNRNTDNARRQE